MPFPLHSYLIFVFTPVLDNQILQDPVASSPLLTEERSPNLLSFIRNVKWIRRAFLFSFSLCFTSSINYRFGLVSEIPKNVHRLGAIIFGGVALTIFIIGFILYRKSFIDDTRLLLLNTPRT